MNRRPKYADRNSEVAPLTQRAALLHRAGLKRAAMEGRCRSRHSQYLKDLGYAYCPWCGQEIVIRHHCEHCQRDFTSDAAYVVHLALLEDFQSNPCPNQQENETSHPVQWRKNRKRFYCPICDKEYAKRTEAEEPPVDARIFKRTSKAA